MVLGATAMIAAIPVTSQLIRSEIPILIVVSLIAGFCLWDLTISLSDSLILLAGLIAYMIFLYRKQANMSEDSLENDEDEVEQLSHHPLPKALLYFVIGLAVLLISSDILVWGAKHIASAFGVSELIIGLTVVAVGTSLPELAASVASALRGHHEIAFGNVIGSNIFNLLVVLAMPGFITETTLDASALLRDYSAMLLITVLWVIMMLYCVKRGSLFNRYMGAVLIAAYAGYYVILFQQL
jgi:cation:H+ antiporter